MTPVIFRRFDGEVIAVFPATSWDRAGNMTCYAHVGQHGACSLEWYRDTVPASLEESMELRAELVQQGYNDLVNLRDVMKTRDELGISREAYRCIVVDCHY